MTTFDPSNLKFEILCIDQEGKVNFSTEKKFIDALSFNEQLWDEIEILETSFGFIDKNKGIKVFIQKLDTSKVVSDLFASAFILTIEAIKIATEQAVSSQSMLQESERDIIPDREDQKSLDKQPVVATSQLLQERLKFISEEKFIEKLAECERGFKNSGKDFVGLRLFVMEILGVQGYSYNSSYAAINILADKGDIEIYDVENPGNYGNMPTKAIKVSQTHRMS